MFPKTTKFNEMFPHTGDLHAGVSCYVETVVLLSAEFWNQGGGVTFNREWGLNVMPFFVPGKEGVE